MEVKTIEPTTTAVVTESEVTTEDILIEKLGYDRQYRRVLKTLANVAVGITCASPMMGLMVICYYQIIFGGYWGLTWGWIIPAFLFFPQALALAELCSSMPTNGALYWWTAALAPPKLSRAMSFVSGWTIYVQNVSVLASMGYAIGSSYGVLISIVQPSWIPTIPQKMAIAMAMIVSWAFINAVKMEKLSIMFHVFATFVVLSAAVFIIGLPATRAAQGRPFTSARTIFTEYTNYSDWDRSVAVSLTYLAVAFVVNGWQVPAFIVEETHNARTKAPKAMLTSYVATAIISFLACVVSALCIEDMEATAADTTGFPLYTLVLDHFGQKGGVAFLIIIVTCTALSGSSLLFSYSSQLAAFARDGGLPFSKTFAYVHPRTNMPVSAMVLLCITSFLLLIFSLSAIAGSILYSLAIVATYLTNALPIALRLFAGDRFVQGPFNYGKFSWPIHAWAVSTMIYLMVMASFPLTPNWTQETFNYNWCVALGAVLLALFLWVVYGRKHYRGVNLDALRGFREMVQTDR